MAASWVKAVPGTRDILGDAALAWQEVERVARERFQRFGYREIRTPILEEAALFARGLGEGTEIVEKQMYVFEDRGGRRLCLRPEATAAVVRAYLEHHLHKTEGLVKLYYLGPMFRSERPQAGRYRQFHQMGVEAIGVRNAYLDAEVIALLVTLLEAVGLRGSRVRLNTLGSVEDKRRTAERVRDTVRVEKGLLSSLCAACQARFERNVFRLLDCKEARCQEVVRKFVGPIQVSREAEDYFGQVQDALGHLKIPGEGDRYLARGIDYYTDTVFEVTHERLGAQDAVAAGGRYDNLVKAFGGPDVGAVGFALGMDRLLLALEEPGRAVPPAAGSGPDVFMATQGSDAWARGFALAHRLRQEGWSVELDYQQRSLKGQLRAADKMRARRVVILGDEEVRRDRVTVKDLAGHAQREMTVEELVAAMRGVPG